jgi:hypothetical protein
VRIFKTKEFARFARREGITDDQLKEAIERIEKGLMDADLGAGLVKQRVARKGGGRSGGFRTVIAYRARTRSVFLFGFAKSTRANLKDDELRLYRKLAEVYLQLTPAQIEELIDDEELMEVEDGDD